MQNTTQPIDRASLLIEANKLIRDHEDTLAGIEATGVEQRNGVLIFSGEKTITINNLTFRNFTNTTLTVYAPMVFNNVKFIDCWGGGAFLDSYEYSVLEN